MAGQNQGAGQRMDQQPGRGPMPTQPGPPTAGAGGIASDPNAGQAGVIQPIPPTDTPPPAAPAPAPPQAVGAAGTGQPYAGGMDAARDANRNQQRSLIDAQPGQNQGRALGWQDQAGQMRQPRAGFRPDGIPPAAPPSAGPASADDERARLIASKQMWAPKPAELS